MADFDTLFAAASAARAKAHAPYSHYAVGAAILADDGKVYGESRPMPTGPWLSSSDHNFERVRPILADLYPDPSPWET